jgi:hypothetical protein
VSSTTICTLIVGRDGPEAADPASVVGSEIEVMKDILAAVTDTLTRGTASTIERVTMQAARLLASRPGLVNHHRTSA